MRRTELSLIAIIVLLLAGAALPVLAAGEGVIEGRVVNGTVGGGSTGGLQVTLHIFQQNSERPSVIASTDAEGSFRFQGLEVGSDWLYVIRVSYKDVVYSKGPLSFEPNQHRLEADIPVYETTTDNSNIVVERAHLLMTFSEDTLRITEMHVFSNPGDRTYVGTEEVDGQRVTSRFLLPQGSRDLAFDDGSLGGRFRSIKGGFADTEAEWPGRTTVVFQYTLDCRTGECSFIKQLTHPTVNLNVMIPDMGVRVETDRLSFEGTLSAEGQSFLNYAGHNLKLGERLTLRLVRSSRDVPGAAATGRNPFVGVLVALAAAAVVLVLIYPLWQQRRRGPADRTHKG